MKTPWYVLTAALCGLLIQPSIGHADIVYMTTPTGDAFLAAGSAGNPVGSDLTGLNFGGTGNLAISPASSLKGEFDSVIKFNLNGAHVIQQHLWCGKLAGYRCVAESE